jgi:hypothetical protein
LTLVGSVTPNVTLPSTLTYMYVATAGSTNTVLYDDIRISDAVLADAQLGYHGSFTTAPGPQMLQSAVAPATVAPATGYVGTEAISPELNTAAPAASLQPPADAGSNVWVARGSGARITGAPINTHENDVRSAFTTSGEYFKHRQSGDATALTDPQGFLFVSSADAAHYLSLLQINMDIAIGRLA